MSADQPPYDRSFLPDLARRAYEQGRAKLAVAVDHQAALLVIDMQDGFLPFLGSDISLRAGLKGSLRPSRHRP
jgi:isochorismate hydrolase